MKKWLEFLKLRIHNYGFWISIFSLVVLVLQTFEIPIFPHYDLIVNIILLLLLVFGIINNPTTTNKWFGDDKKEHEMLNQIEDTLKELKNEDQEKNDSF